MKIELRLITMAVVATILIFTTIAQAGSRSRSLNENAALDLLQRTLKRDHVYEKRLSLDCIEYGTEEKTNAYFEFVLREIHNAKCGGDPEISPAIDRYRVYRRSGKIEQWEAASDTWHAYKGAQTRQNSASGALALQLHRAATEHVCRAGAPPASRDAVNSAKNSGRYSAAARTQIALAEASAIMISCR